MIHRRRHVCAGLAALFALTMAPIEVLAQRATGNYGKPTYAGRAAGRRISHARDYARGARQYSVRAPQVIVDYGKEDAEEIARNIEGAKKDLAIVKNEFAADKDILARIDAIEKHLAAATAQQKEMHEECCKPNPDQDKTMACCSDCLKELDKAKAEHDALMRKIDPTWGVGADPQKTQPPKKGDDKK